MSPSQLLRLVMTDRTRKRGRSDMGSADRALFPGDIVSHFKRDFVTDEERGRGAYLYKIICVAHHTEANEGEDDRMVVYQAMYGDFLTYVRPYGMFMSEVDRDKYPDAKQRYRFEKVHR